MPTYPYFGFGDDNGGNINGRPGHGQRTIDNGLISGCSDAVGRKLGLMVDCWQ